MRRNALESGRLEAGVEGLLECVCRERIWSLELEFGRGLELSSEGSDDVESDNANEDDGMEEDMWSWGMGVRRAT